MKIVLSVLALLVCAETAVAEDHVGSRLVVGQPDTHCPNPQFGRIQDAITAATPGTTIFVCAGVYNEQPQISKPLKIKFDDSAAVRPNGVVQNGVSLSSGIPFAALLLVTNSAGVEIEGGQFDGSQAGITGCSPRLFGIVFQNASGKIRRSLVNHIHLADNLNGCQSGTGILVQSGNNGSSRVTIDGTRLSDYQKNGITIDGVGSDADIRFNRVTGVGPTAGAAQNGIQVGFGATGEVFKNVVTANQWGPCVSLNQCEFFASGILVVESSGVRVSDNQVSSNQVNVVLDGDHNSAKHNSLLNAVVLDGIQVLGNDCRVEQNLIAQADRSGAYVAGNNAEIERNVFVEMPVGILKLAGVIGLDQDLNRFINVAQDFVDPPSYSMRKPDPEKL